MDPNLAFPAQPSNQMSRSAFSFNYDPSVITAFSANPTANIQGAISPTGNQNLSFQNNSTPNTQNTSATDITAPKLQAYGTNSTNSNTTGNSPSSINPNANSLLNLAASKSRVGNSLLNSVNSFGTRFGFAGDAADSAANLASFGVAPGASTEAAAAAADETAGFAAGASDAGASTFGATLGGTLGAAGLGAMGGGILASALGENATGGSIGGALGAAIGNMILPGIGGIIGGIGGSIFGGAFGNNTPATQAAEGVYTIDKTGQVVLAGSGNKNPQNNSGIQNQLATQFNQQIEQAKSIGIDLQYNPSKFRAGVNTLYSPSGQPGYIQVGGKTLAFSPGNQTSQTNAVNSAVLQLAKQNGATPEQLTALTAAFKGTGAQGTINNQAPSIPNNPTSSGPSDFQKFVAEYKAKQSANAAPTPTS